MLYSALIPILSGMLYLAILLRYSRSLPRRALLTGVAFSITTIVWCGIELQLRGREQAKVAIAQSEIHDIEHAVSNYLEVDRAPKGELNANIFGDDNQQILMASLTEATPQSEPFMMVAPGKLVDGKLIDPWGKPYHIAIDLKRSGSVWVPFYGTLPNRRVGVWSSGPHPIESWNLMNSTRQP